MRRTVWLLTIPPLVALCIVVGLRASAQAAVMPTALTAINGMVTEYFAGGKSSVAVYNARNAEELTLALQVTVTPTTPPITPALVLPRLTPTVTPTVLPTGTATVQISPTRSISNTSISNTAALSTTLSTGQNLSTTTSLTSTGVITTATPATVTTVITTADDTEVLDAEYAGPIEGTIVANRTESNVRFFVEGATYELAPLRSIGLALPRVTAVLNLFNCDATLPETQAGCFWDPYLLDREGFYEIISSEEAGETAGLTLQAAGSPPVNQIWLQNRTGQREQIFYAGETYDLPPSTVQEFTTESADPVLFYLRSCLDVAGRSVCEWTPNDATPGVYYALVELTASGTVPNSSESALQLQALFGETADIVPEPEATAVAPVVSTEVVCQVDVPALNVRSGPGLQYQIISKVRSTEQEPATILVIGRDAEAQWFAVADEVAIGGWVTGSSGFVTCQGDTAALPEIQVTNAQLAPTPVATEAVVAVDTTTPGTPADDTPAPVAEVPVEVVPEEAVPTATVAVQTLLDGQSLIVINNGFEQQVRFTLDQRYRVVEGPSEYDLQPGQSVSLLVYPGPIAFSASSPWNGLSGNEEFIVAEKETRNLWIIFMPDPDGSGRWLLQY